MPYTKSTGGSGELSKINTFSNTYNGGWGHEVDCVHLGGLGDEGSASRYFYCAKASPRDRDEGLEDFDEQPPATTEYRPFLAREFEEGNQDKHNDFLRLKPKRNNHPTVKPCELMQYLVRLVTPKGGTVLDPFNGSGSTGKAVAYENFDRDANYKYIGIELSSDYLAISDARIRFVEKQIKQIKLF
jgi:site-specific DNA-methyltransferase (adenine-specific)